MLRQPRAKAISFSTINMRKPGWHEKELCASLMHAFLSTDPGPMRHVKLRPTCQIEHQWSGRNVGLEVGGTEGIFNHVLTHYQYTLCNKQSKNISMPYCQPLLYIIGLASTRYTHCAKTKSYTKSQCKCSKLLQISTQVPLALTL
jgi:hypothetical protein